LENNKFSWEYLSVTRFFLAFVVLCGHLADFTTALGPLYVFVMMGAFEAVLGFLLISGFSIGHSIQRNEQSFFKRRLQRIYPVYLASIALAFAVNLPPLTSGTFWELFWNLIFFNQIVTSDSFVGPAWSLSLEVWLYCLAPVFLKASDRQLRALMYVSFAAYSLYECGRIIFDWTYFSGVGYGLNLLLLSFVWIAGFACTRNKAFRKDIFYLLAGHVLVVATFKLMHYIGRHQIEKFVFGYSLRILLGTLVLVLSYGVIVYNRQLPRVLGRLRHWFDFLGNISYPLYLTHYATFRLLARFVKPAWYIFAPAALLVATAFYFAFDFYTQKRGKTKAKQIPASPILVNKAV
jgi:peptidoglycan/LPS O-acetylase OafA/YrhL